MTGSSKKTSPTRGGATSASKTTGAPKKAKTAKTAKTPRAANGRSRATSKGAARQAPHGRLFEPAPAPTRVDYPLLERDVQQWWDEHDILNKYLTRNEQAEKRWSFMDGPITANNPMGVHHAWGRPTRTSASASTRCAAIASATRTASMPGAVGGGGGREGARLHNKRQIEEYGIDRFVDSVKSVC